MILRKFIGRHGEIRAWLRHQRYGFGPDVMPPMSQSPAVARGIRARWQPFPLDPFARPANRRAEM